MPAQFIPKLERAFQIDLGAFLPATQSGFGDRLGRGIHAEGIR